MEKLKVEVIKERKEEMRQKIKRRKHKHIVFPRHRTYATFKLISQESSPLHNTLHWQAIPYPVVSFFLLAKVSATADQSIRCR